MENVIEVAFRLVGSLLLGAALVLAFPVLLAIDWWSRAMGWPEPDPSTEQERIDAEWKTWRF